MKIVFLCKRRYTNGHDVVTERYGRLYEIPHQISLHGHTVLSLCYGYQGQQEGVWQHNAAPGELIWKAQSFHKLRPLRVLGYPQDLLRHLRTFNPDILIGASDIPHVVLTRWLASRLNKPYCIDIYDNFESFGQARFPGMKSALKRAVRNAALVVAASSPLLDLARDKYGARGALLNMPNAVNTDQFRPMSKETCRRALSLPTSGRLIGTAGGLHRTRGIANLYEAWRLMAIQDPALHLVLAGKTDDPRSIPKDPRVHYLGQLPHSQIALLFSALDVGIVYLRDTAFGRYCFPQKAYEMLACNLPIVAADVGAMTRLFSNMQGFLYQPDDPQDLAAKIQDQLSHPLVPDVQIENWPATGTKLELHLRAAVAHAMG
ncbi:MAG TPA: glycosyltransferase family 4 protein [Gammaproteobacteria bacterium]|nr:glycosyltransferase family 4 protein [Gammaproteobacteria bacterium]